MCERPEATLAHCVGSLMSVLFPGGQGAERDRAKTCGGHPARAAEDHAVRRSRLPHSGAAFLGALLCSSVAACKDQCSRLMVDQY